MMHGREKSDSAILAVKPPNGAGVPAEESVERRAGAEGNAGQDRTHRAQDRESVSQGLDRVRHVARTRKTERFTALLHHVSPDLLRMAFFALKRSAAPGVDGLTWQTYEAGLDRRIEDLPARAHRGAYRALLARRGFIPKADGSRRPLAIAALEGRIVQRATADIRSYFDAVSQKWLLRFLNHRIGDPRIIRLIQKWLRAGVLEDGVVNVS